MKNTAASPYALTLFSGFAVIIAANKGVVTRPVEQEEARCTFGGCSFLPGDEERICVLSYRVGVDKDLLPYLTLIHTVALLSDQSLLTFHVLLTFPNLYEPFDQ
jgi:hypothetical protein